MHIPVYKPYMRGNEASYVKSCLETGWISSKGEFVTQFEARFADYINAKHATSVCNGTVALHLALLAIGVKSGDEVIVPTLTYIASVNALAYVGAKPVFVDSDPDTWNIDVSQIKSKITARTKAILVVHLYGAVCDMNPIRKLSQEHGLLLIEDVAEAFGSLYHGQFAGTFGDISTFSFFGNKTITTGEGGMVVARDEKNIIRASKIKSQSVSTNREYWHDEIGYNYRMTNICAAIGLAQLENADYIIATKRKIASWYMECLSSLPLKFQKELPDTIHTYWMVSVIAEDNKIRDVIRKTLMQNGIETRPLFPPVHTMPVFKSCENFIVAEDLSSRGINLPSYPELSRSDVEYICEKIRLCFYPIK